MDSQDDVTQPGNEEHTDRLDQLSDDLYRALRGIFVFPLQKLPIWFGFIWKFAQRLTLLLKEVFVRLFWTLPKKIFGWLVYSANYLVRIGKVALLILMIVTAVFGPLLMSLKVGHSALAIGLSIAWCLFAIVGAVWGLINLNKSRWKIRQAIGRYANKLRLWRRSNLPESVEN